MNSMQNTNITEVSNSQNSGKIDSEKIEKIETINYELFSEENNGKSQKFIIGKEEIICYGFLPIMKRHSELCNGFIDIDDELHLLKDENVDIEPFAVVWNYMNGLYHRNELLLVKNLDNLELIINYFNIPRTSNIWIEYVLSFGIKKYRTIELLENKIKHILTPLTEPIYPNIEEPSFCYMRHRFIYDILKAFSLLDVITNIDKIINVFGEQNSTLPYIKLINNNGIPYNSLFPKYINKWIDDNIKNLFITLNQYNEKILWFRYNNQLYWVNPYYKKSDLDTVNILDIEFINININNILKFNNIEKKIRKQEWEKLLKVENKIQIFSFLILYAKDVKVII